MLKNNQLLRLRLTQPKPTLQTLVMLTTNQLLRLRLIQPKLDCLFSICISLSEVCSKYRGCLLIGPNDKFACDVQGNQRLTSLYNDLLQS